MTVLSRCKQLYEDDSWGRKDHIEYFRNVRFTKLFQSAMGIDPRDQGFVVTINPFMIPKGFVRKMEDFISKMTNKKKD